MMVRVLVRRRSIQRIPEQGVTNRGEMHPDLVASRMVRPDFDARAGGLRNAREDLGACRLCTKALSLAWVSACPHLAAIVRVGSDRKVDHRGRSHGA